MNWPLPIYMATCPISSPSFVARPKLKNIKSPGCSTERFPKASTKPTASGPGSGVTPAWFQSSVANIYANWVMLSPVYTGDNMTQFAYMFATEDWNHAGVTPDPGPLAVGFVDALGNLSVLQPGDLMFFNFGRATKEGEEIGHVAMYIGNGQFIHTANKTENCAIKSLYTLKNDGTVTWSSYAKSCIKITHLLDCL